MQIQIQHRAEVSLRSLGKAERTQIIHALDQLAATKSSLLYSNPNLRRLASKFPYKKMYIYEASQKLTLIISIEEDTCTVQDIIDQDRLNLLLPRLRQE
jgi:hypothetical protein